MKMNTTTNKDRGNYGSLSNSMLRATALIFSQFLASLTKQLHKVVLKQHLIRQGMIISTLLHRFFAETGISLFSHVQIQLAIADLVLHWLRPICPIGHSKFYEY